MELVGKPIKMLDVKNLSEFLTKNADAELYPTIFVMTPNGVLLAYNTPANVPNIRQQAALLGKAWARVEAAFAKNKYNSAVENDHHHAHRPGLPRNASASNVSGNFANQPFNPAFIATPTKLQDGDLEVMTLPYTNGIFIVKAIQPGILAAIIGTSLKDPSAALPKCTNEVRGSPNNPPHPAAHLNRKISASTQPKKDDPSTEAADANGAEGVKSDGKKENAPEDKDEDEEIPVPDQVDNAFLLMITRIKLDGIVDYIRKEFEAEDFVMPTDADIMQVEARPRGFPWDL